MLEEIIRSEMWRGGQYQQLESMTYNHEGKLIEQETVDNSFRYSGELWDRTTQLQYLRARWYDPSVGRFISKDTYEGDITNPLTLNLYTYTANNPLRYIDPSGHCFTEWLGKKYCKAAWESVKEQAKIEWEFLKQAHSSYYSAADYWSMGTLSELNEYYRISKENPYSLEQFLAAGMIFIEVTPQGKVSKLTNKGQDFLKNAIKACNCFTAGTKVLTDEGEKNIEDIEVGDKVLAKSEYDSNGKLAYKEVTALYRNQRDDIIKLYVEEQIIETTDNHPFWVEGKGWSSPMNFK
ncbi:RHS repeat-associated core domain-containing protein [Paenibacillus roseus]|uniref:RHS repeat-associated core domain-containing protein n=1 Tax=Paenibacillus TaxID=44249 RepID=UPI002FCE3BE3